jgi:hypothetical protein
MARLDIARQAREEPLRIAHAICKLEELGFKVEREGAHELRFEYKGEIKRWHEIVENQIYRWHYVSMYG